MADFSIQEAAFTGFGVVREHRRYLAVWAGLSLAFSFLVVFVLVSVAGPSFTALQSLSVSGNRNPEEVFPLLGRLVPFYLVVVSASCVFYGVIFSAMNRAVLRPAETSFGYLAFGSDEARQISLLFLTFILFTASYILLIVVLSIVVALVGVLAHVPPALLGIVAACLALGVMTWVAVRFSLASALTFQRRRLTLFGSWAVTKGRFWPIFGTYVLVLALASMVAMLTWLVIFAIVAVVAGGNISRALAPPNLQSARDYFSATQVMQLILGSGVSALMWPVVLTPPAAILRQITAAGQSGVAGFIR